MYTEIKKFNLELHKKYLTFVTNDAINHFNSSNTQQSSVFIHGIYWVLCCSDLIQFKIFDKLLNARSNCINLLKKCQRKLFIDNFFFKYYSINPFDFTSPSILSILSGMQINIIINNKITQNNKFELDSLFKSLITFKGEKTFINNSKSCLRQFDVRFVYSTLLVHYLSYYSDLSNSEPFFQISRLTELLIEMQNKDGGFGKRYKDESHAGYTFCAVASIAIIKKITKNDSIHTLFNFNRLTRWLLKRIIVSENHNNIESKSYCFNGRIGKKCDVCYSWWVIASLKIVEIINNKTTNDSFILSSNLIKELIAGILCHQNFTHGGFQKSPFVFGSKSRSDPLHTFLSISALSLLFNNNLKHSSFEFYGPTNTSEKLFPIIKIDPISVLAEKYFL